MRREIKKTIAVLLSCILLLAICPTGFAAEFSDATAGDYFYEEAQMLCALGIVSGDAAGTLRPYAALSRGEFAKLAVGMKNKLDEAKAQKGASRFTDVSTTHWATPYINYVAQTGIIVGYPDGTFHAEEKITYAQAITVILRVLGYDEKAVDGFWPDSYISKAASLDITDGITFDAYASISRADAFVMIARALGTSMYNSSGNLASSFGYTIIEDAVILSTYLTDAALATGEVKAASGTYKCADASVARNLEGKKVKLYLNEKKEIAAVAAYADFPLELVIKKHLGAGEYLCAFGGADTAYKFSDSMTVYSASGKSSYAQMSNAFAPGATVTLHGETKGSYDYAYIRDAQDIIPVVATKDYVAGETSIGGIALEDADKITVYRDGYSAKLTDIRQNDVIYYNPTIHTMEVYVDKVTGLYEQALPNKANVTQVVVGSRTFNIETAAATRQLDESVGSFKINDVVTLLLGKDGAVVGVCNLQTSSVASAYGVVLNAGTYITDKVTDTGTTKKQVKLMMSDGNVYTYDAVADYSNEKGELVRVNFKNDEAVLTKVRGGSFAGEVSQINRSIGDTMFATDAVIFDLVSNPTNGDATVKVLDFEDLRTIAIDAVSVLASVKEGGFSEVVVVLFDDVMKTNVKYGVVEKIATTQNADTTTRTYTVLVDGNRQTVSRKGTFSVGTGVPVMVTYEGNSIDMLNALAKVATASAIQAMDYNRIKVNNRIFTLSSDLLIYYQNDLDTYMTLSRSELEKANIGEIVLYEDFTNQVRAIKVTLK